MVLKDSGEPMNIKTIMEKINERGLAKLAEKTPSATISAAIQMEIKRKNEVSRFVKSGKGLFAPGKYGLSTFLRPSIVGGRFVLHPRTM